MLEQKDLCAIAELLDSRIGKTEDMIKETNKRVSEVEKKLSNRIERVENRVSEVEKKLTNRIERVEKRVSEVESMLVNELVRTEDILTRRMEKVENNIKELNRNFQIQNGKTALILEEYHKRLLILEEKGA